MFKHQHLAIALAGALMLPVFAMAEQPVRVTIGEGSLIFPDPVSTLTRDEVRAALRESQRNPLGADGWRRVDGEAGWILESHRIRFDNGRLAHAQDCPLNKKA